MYTLILYQHYFTDPRSNTGSDSHPPTSERGQVEARMDSLSILWTFQASVLIEQHLATWLDIAIDKENSIGRKIGVWWDYNYSSPTGTLLSMRHKGNGKIGCRLSLSGEDCGRLGNLRIRGFMKWCSMNLLDLVCTRIDLAVDDFTKQLDFVNLQTAIRAKQHAGFQVGDCLENFGRKHNGWTAYMGSRESDNFVRAYNKSAESKGLVDSHRWENEVKGLKSIELFSLILGFPEDGAEFQKCVINYAVGGIKFIDKIDKNIDRCPLLDWWKNWIEFLDAVPMKPLVRRSNPTLANTKQWLKHAVSKSLAMMNKALGSYRFEHFIKELMLDGDKRMNELDFLKVEDYVKEILKYEDIIALPTKITLVG